MTTRTPVLAVGIALALAAGGATACRDEPMNCTLVGCAPSLQVQSTTLRPNQAVEVCVGATCVLADPVGGVSFGDVEIDAAVADARVVVRENGAVVSEQRRPIPVTEGTPNGPTCPPRCKAVRVEVGPAGFR